MRDIIPKRDHFYYPKKKKKKSGILKINFAFILVAKKKWLTQNEQSIVPYRVISYKCASTVHIFSGLSCVVTHIISI